MTSVWLLSPIFFFFLFSFFFFFLFCFFFLFSFFLKIFFSFLNVFFLSLFVCIFVYLSISSIHSEQIGRGPVSVTTLEEGALMSAVRQLHGRPTPRNMSGASPNSLTRCSTWCESSSVPQCASPRAPSHCRARAQRPGCSRYF